MDDFIPFPFLSLCALVVKSAIAFLEALFHRGQPVLDQAFVGIVLEQFLVGPDRLFQAQAFFQALGHAEPGLDPERALRIVPEKFLVLGQRHLGLAFQVVAFGQAQGGVIGPGAVRVLVEDGLQLRPVLGEAAQLQEAAGHAVMNPVRLGEFGKEREQAVVLDERVGVVLILVMVDFGPGQLGGGGVGRAGITLDQALVSAEGAVILVEVEGIDLADHVQGLVGHVRLGMVHHHQLEALDRGQVIAGVEELLGLGKAAVGLPGRAGGEEKASHQDTKTPREKVLAWRLGAWAVNTLPRVQFIPPRPRRLRRPAPGPSPGPRARRSSRRWFLPARPAATPPPPSRLAPG